jgi:hypothetical protein
MSDLPPPQPPSMEDRALKFIEANNKAIWVAIALLALVVVLFKKV